MDTALIELDDRRRAALGKLAGNYSRFLADVASDGTITLTPAHVISARELAVLSSPTLRAELRRGVDDAKAGRVVPVPWDVLDALGDDDDELQG